MSASVSGLYIAITAIMAVYLTLRVIKLRRKFSIGIGVAGNESLRLADRVHGNLLENAPIAMGLLLVAELNGLPALYIHIIGIVWLIARVLHAVGLIQGKGGYHFGRFWGVLTTWLVILTLSVVNVVYFAVS
ncbi:MAPEG family protein [Shewanella colwelliana]|uniref:MAPEG family protein n=1 Tax=Shewanella colwelliana TaxID=23 RepID=UPI0022AFA095|nr:MAPEG family protein [Shewanella colwelliana]MCZ4339482.1 MAPEG family protein [Shewanella colwelliana]